MAKKYKGIDRVLRRLQSLAANGKSLITILRIDKTVVQTKRQETEVTRLKK